MGFIYTYLKTGKEGGGGYVFLIFKKKKKKKKYFFQRRGSKIMEHRTFRTFGFSNAVFIIL